MNAPSSQIYQHDVIGPVSLTLMFLPLLTIRYWFYLAYSATSVTSGQKIMTYTVLIWKKYGYMQEDIP